MVIEVKNVTKKYNRTIALDGISFTLEHPKIYGLLGQNGAGKTTFMQLLSGHQLPTSGQIYINGKQPFEQRNITEQICFIKENDNFAKDLKVKQVLQIYKNFYPKWNEVLAFNLIKQYNLSLNKRIKALSKGMVSALGIIVGLASRAEITIFDEPYIGLDAPKRQMFYDTLLDEYEKEKRTVIFSTHLIDEASKLFEEVILLRKGKLLLHETVDTLRKKACAVTGKTEVVNNYIENKKVLKSQQIGPLKTAFIYGEDVSETNDQLSFNRLSLQDLMIQLTEYERGVSDESTN